MTIDSSTSAPAARSAAAETSPATAGDRIRQVAVLLSAVLGFAVAFLGSGAVGGVPVNEVAGGAFASDATLVAPGGPAFSIWGVIYTGLILLALWQAMPSRGADPRQRQVGWWIVASGVLNAAWVLAVQAELVYVSVGLIVALLAVLVTCLVRLTQSPSTSRYEQVVVDGSLGLYLGWVCIATVANSAAALVYGGVNATSSAAVGWAIAILVVAAGVGLLLGAGLRRLAPGLGLAWGLTWVAVERFTGEPDSTAVAIAAAVAAVVTLLAAIAFGTRRTAVEN